VTAVSLTLIGRRAAARADAAGLAAAGEATSAPSPAPATDAVIETVGPGIRWRAVPGARSYHLQIADSIGVPVLQADLPDTTYVPAVGALPPGRRYHWWVAATDATGRVRRSAAVAVPDTSLSR